MPSWGDEELEQLYDEHYFPSLTKWWEQVRARVNPKRRLDAVEHYASSRISRFLEVGCGPGYGLVWRRRCEGDGAFMVRMSPPPSPER